MKNTNTFWLKQIQDRKLLENSQLNIDVVCYFSSVIQNINNEYSYSTEIVSKKDSVIFMDNIAHVLKVEFLNDFSSNESKKLINFINKDELSNFINCLIDNAISYHKRGYTLNMRQLAIVTKFLAFKNYEALLKDKEKKKVLNYLKGKKKKAIFV